MRRANRTFDAALAAGAVLAALFLLGPTLTIPRHIPLGYNEGWNAYLAQRAVGAAAGPLYPPADTLVFNNYPPLSFFVVGAFARVAIGDMIVAGRIVALASLLASAALLGLSVRRLGGSVRGGAAACILLLLFAAVVFPRYVAVDEPQWFGHALALAGLAVLLGGDMPTRFAAGRVAAAAVLMAAAGTVKHLLVGLPIAVTLWLALTDRRAAAIWLVVAAAAVGAAVLLSGFAFGPAALADILQHRRIFHTARIVAALVRLLPPLLPMAIIAALAWRARRSPDPPMLFACLFVATATLTGLVERAGDGVNYNAHFETLLACCLAAGLAISRSKRPARLAGFAALPLLVFAPLQAGQAWRGIVDGAGREAAWQPMIARIAAAPDLAGCDTLSLCFWAGKPYAVDVFNLEQDILTGGSIARFDALARAHRFGMFEFDGAAPGHDLLWQDLVRHGYRAGSTGPAGSVLLTPPIGRRQQA